MAITKDASAPVEVKLLNSTSGTGTTARYSPPAGSLVVTLAAFGYDTNTTTGPTVTCADSSSVSYTAGPTAYDGGATGCYIFQHYYATAPGSITTTVTRTVALGAAMFYIKTWVLDGCAATQTGAASTSTHAQTGTSLTAAITPTKLNSWVLVAAAEGNTQAMTASGLTQDTQFNNTSDGVSAATGHQSTSALTAETLGWTVATAPFWSWAAWEILPAASVPPASAIAYPSSTWRTRYKPRQHYFQVPWTQPCSYRDIDASTSADGGELITVLPASGEASGPEADAGESVNAALASSDASGPEADAGEQLGIMSPPVLFLPSRTWLQRYRPARHWLQVPTWQPGSYGDIDTSGPEADAGEAVTAAVPSSDASGTGADSSTIAATLASQESSGSNDTGTTVGLGAADASGAAADSSVIAALLSDADASSAADSGTIGLSDTDSSHGTDAGESVSVLASSSDASGATVDAGEQLGIMSAPVVFFPSRTWLQRYKPSRHWLQTPTWQPSSYGDIDTSGPEADAGESVAATLASQDASGSTDSGTTVGLGAADSSSSTDSSSIAATLSSADSSGSTDSGTVIGLSDTDSSHGTDAGESLAVTLSSADASGTTADAGESVQVLTVTVPAAALPSRTWLQRYRPARHWIQALTWQANTHSDFENGYGTDAGEQLAVSLSDTDGAHGTESDPSVITLADPGTCFSSSPGLAVPGAFSPGQLCQEPPPLNESGHGSDGAEFIAEGSSDSDTGHGTDAGTLTASVPSADASASVETAVITASLSSADTGRGTDGGENITGPAVSDTDASLGEDAEFDPVSSADAGTGTDAGTVAVHVSGAFLTQETSSASDGGESLTGTFVPRDTEASHGSDTGYLSGAAFSSADAVHGFDQDQGNVFPAASADASGTTVDAGESVAKNVPVSDTDASGTAADTTGAITAQLTAAKDTGHGTDGGEALSGTFLVASSDTGRGTDSGYLSSASFASADASQAFDAESRVFGPNAAPSSSDAGTGTEAAVVDVYAYQPPFRWTGGGFELRPQSPLPAPPKPQALRTTASAEPALRVQVEITAAGG